MGAKLDMKKWLYTSIAVFVALSLMEGLLHRVLFIPMFPEVFPQGGGDRDITLLRLYLYLGRAIYSVAFVYIFAKGLEGKPGVGEGIRYGFWIGVLIPIPFFLASLVITSFPFGPLLLRMISIVIEAVICGIVANFVFNKMAQKS